MSKQTKLHKILTDAASGITWAVQHPVEAKHISRYYGATAEDHIVVAEKEIIALFLELIGEDEVSWIDDDGNKHDTPAEKMAIRNMYRAELRKKVEVL